MAAFYLDKCGREPLKKPISNPLTVKLFGHLHLDHVEPHVEPIKWTHEDFYSHEESHASYREMLLTQPGVNCAFLTYNSDHTESVCVVSNAKGVTLGDVVDELESLVMCLGGQEARIQGIVGASTWSQLAHYEEIETIVDCETILPPSQGVSFESIQGG